MAKQKELPEIDLDVSDVKRIALTTDPQGETIISFEMTGGQVMNLVFSPEMFGKLEAMMARPTRRRLKSRPSNKTWAPVRTAQR